MGEPKPRETETETRVDAPAHIVEVQPQAAVPDAPTQPTGPVEPDELPAPDPEVLRTLGQGRRRRRLGWILAAVVMAALVGLGTWVALAPEKPLAFRMEEAAKRSLVVTVTATGSLEPLHQVDVGAEISGRVAEVLVDFNDKVEAGQLLARLDTDLLSLQVEQGRAQLALSQANLAQARAALADADRTLNRVGGLVAKGAASTADLDSAQAVVDRASPGLKAAEAQVQAARAALNIARSNLKRSQIKSPIAGTIISRMVEPGQVVVASLQAPVLFRVAKDLQQMQLRAEVDEADIGHIRPGQDATFTVAAYPGREFTAKLTDVYNAPRTIAQVVTYQALLEVDNAEGLLRPGMTVTTHVVTERHDEALTVPNAALRFKPPAKRQMGVPAAVTTGEGVYIPGDPEPERVPVTTGGTDGSYTIIVNSDLEPGQDVLVGRVREDKP